MRGGSQAAQAGAEAPATRRAAQQPQLEVGSSDRVGWTGARGLRAPPIPGGGFNLFKALRWEFRAFVTAKPG